MRVDVLGAVSVHGSEGSVSGLALGGRRVRVALVALALAEAPVSADRLAEILWSDEPPRSWQVALRGVIRALRGAVAEIGLGDQRLVATVPSGYVLAPDIDVDVRLASASIRTGARLLTEGRYAAAALAVEPASRLDGSGLLPDEGLEWLTPHRVAVDQTRLRALGILIEAASALGDHERAVDHARTAVQAAPLDEQAYRWLIHALDRAGNRAGVVRAYEQCRAVLADELGIDPSSETVDAYLAALHDQVTGSVARLPAKQSSFIGRRTESRRLSALLDGPGLVAVTGRGGVGKSRLAAQVVAGYDGFTGGRLWVSLAAVGNDELVASTVAIEIGAQVGANEPAGAIAAHLAPLGRVLLVLDGCEAIVDGAASLVTDLLIACPTLTVLATGRLPLGVEGERVLAIEPLPAPSATDLTALAESQQVRLLADRVRDGGGDLRIDEHTAPLVAALCRRCGGLPLALELVAAQFPVMSLRDLLDDLSTVMVDEHNGLREVLRASLALLDAEEMAVFRRFAVLDGPVGLPLIRHVVAADSLAPVRVVRILRELAARSLLSVDRSEPRWRYRQDDDLHRVAKDLLVAAGELSETLDRLGDAIRELLPDDARATPTEFQGPVTEAIGSVRAFLAAAIDGGVARGRGLELAFRLHRYWAATDVSEGRFWLSRLLADDPESRWTGYARFALGYLSYWAGEGEADVDQLRLAASALSGTGDGFAARALIYLGGLTDDMDRTADALGYVRRAISLTENHGDVSLRVGAVVGLGSLLAERADPSAAEHAARAVELCRANGTTEQLMTMLPTAAMVCWQVGALDAARGYVAEALPLYAGARRIARVVLLSSAAGIAFADGDIDAAVEYGRDADREATEVGVERELPLIRCVLARALLARGDVAGAAEQSVAAIRAARSVSFVHPLANCLETVVLVGLAGNADRRDLARLLRCSDAIRARGDRPGVPALRVGVDAARAGLDVDGADPGDADVITPAEAVVLATRVRDRCVV